MAAESAAEEGWTVVSDTSWEGYEDDSADRHAGLHAMIGEALDALAEPPTHIFLQAGVGGMAAAVAAYASQRLGQARRRSSSSSRRARPACSTAPRPASR